MQEARLYRKMEGGGVECFLCAHRCKIDPGKRGICGVRTNRDGILYSLVYGKIISSAIDPIEKKPFFHFQPSRSAFSFATVGCNFRCMFCQNYNISQVQPSDEERVPGRFMNPGDLVQSVKRSKSSVIAYTYTEPTIFFEYACDVARLAHPEGIRNVFVTNGYMTPEALEEIGGFLDAANIDLKAFRDETYRKYCGARLEPVLETIKAMHKRGVWIEVTTLVIPGVNDSDEELRSIAEFLAGVDPGIPWHVSRFHPDYRLNDVRATPPAILHGAGEIGRAAGLRYVYSGNLPGDERENTSCHSCNTLIIRRIGFEVLENRMRDGKCPECHTEIPGVWT